MTTVNLSDAAHAAIYTRLTGDATLMALVTGVYDDVPDSSSYPYVVLGNDTVEVPEDVFGNQGATALVTLHVWSQYQGAKEALSIMSRINTLLDRYALSVSGYTLVRCVKDMQNVMRDPDGRTRHGVQRFRIEVSET